MWGWVWAVLTLMVDGSGMFSALWIPVCNCFWIEFFNFKVRYKILTISFPNRSILFKL